MNVLKISVPNIFILGDRQPLPAALLSAGLLAGSPQLKADASPDPLKARAVLAVPHRVGAPSLALTSIFPLVFSSALSTRATVKAVLFVGRALPRLQGFLALTVSGPAPRCPLWTRVARTKGCRRTQHYLAIEDEPNDAWTMRSL